MSIRTVRQADDESGNNGGRRLSGKPAPGALVSMRLEGGPYDGKVVRISHAGDREFYPFQVFPKPPDPEQPLGRHVYRHERSDEDVMVYAGFLNSPF